MKVTRDEILRQGPMGGIQSARTEHEGIAEGIG